MKPVTTTVTYDNLGRLTWDVLVRTEVWTWTRRMDGHTIHTHPCIRIWIRWFKVTLVSGKQHALSVGG